MAPPPQPDAPFWIPLMSLRGDLLPCLLSHVSPPASGSLLFCLCLPLFFILTSVSHWAPPPLPPPLSRSLARSLPDPRKGSSAISHAVTPGRHGSSASAAPACLPLAALRRSDRLQLPIGPPRPGHLTGCFYFHSRVFVTHPQNSSAELIPQYLSPISRFDPRCLVIGHGF